MATIGIQLAIGLGAMLLQRLLTPQKVTYGPRISDLNIPAVSPGNPIVRHWGTMKLPCQLVWSSRLIETQHEDGGGKGAPQPKQITYTYSVHAAWAICAGPVARINRIWADQKIVYENPDLAATDQATFDAAYYAELDRLYNQAGLADADEAYVSAFFFAYNNYRLDNVNLSTGPEAVSYVMAHPGSAGGVANIPAPVESDVNTLFAQMLSQLNQDYTYQAYKTRYDAIDLYYGDETQLPNALIETYVNGVNGGAAGKIPAFRGVAYFVMHNLQLEDFGNTVPQMQAEVVKTDGSVFLTDILSDICTDAGLDVSEFDTSRLPAITVPGYAVTQSTSARDAITALQKVYPFDGAESSYKIIFNWINARPHMLMRLEDLGAHVTGDQLPPSDELTRQYDYDLPRRINLKFQEPVRNYSINTVYAERQITDAQTVEDSDVTVAVTRADAKMYIEEQMAVRFAARRGHKFILPRKYILIEPGDPFLLPDKDYPTDTSKRHQLRCVQVSVGMNGLLEMMATDHSYHDIPSAVVESDIDVDSVTAKESSLTYSYLMDCPLLADSDDDDVGFYTVITGSRRGWPGGALLVEVNADGTVTAFGNDTTVSSSNTNWKTIAYGTKEVAHGLMMTSLFSGFRPLVWDTASKPMVWVYDKDTVLYSVSRYDAMAQGINLAMIGDELIAYSGVTQISDNLWQLNEVLRGLRGTEENMNSHTGGERFVFLNSATVQRVSHDVSYLGVPGNFKSVTSGDLLDSVSTFQFTNTGNSLRPRAPVLFRKFREANRDITLQWIPRVRKAGNFLGLLSSASLTLDQATENYEIDVVQGAVVKHTYSFTDTRTWSYSAAAQTTDGVDNAASCTLNLYQTGAIIGRGYVATVTL